jgi:hypothetical protein
MRAATVFRSVNDRVVAGNIGEEHLGDFARHQLEVARHDPRVDRPRGAMVADFFAAMEEAERWREMTTWGLRELSNAVETEEQRLGVGCDDAGLLDDQRRLLQSAWERAAMAKAELANEYPYVHAVTLISMLSALDALVEELVPGVQQMMASSFFERIHLKLTDEQTKAWDELPGEHSSRIKEAIVKTLAGMLPQKPGKPSGVGASRYEDLLARAGLTAPPAAPIPVDLDEALSELASLRHVLVHRGGRVDTKALADAPTLPYEDGAFVRLTRSDYRRYSAAVRAYGTEITRRMLKDIMGDGDLGDWRKSCSATA